MHMHTLYIKMVCIVLDTHDIVQAMTQGSIQCSYGQLWSVISYLFIPDLMQHMHPECFTRETVKSFTLIEMKKTSVVGTTTDHLVNKHILPQKKNSASKSKSCKIMFTLIDLQ